MNITSAGVCANCGWSQFAQVTTVSTKITGEIEIMLSGKALLDDYKRLLLENRNLKERVAELEAEVTKCHELQDSYCDRIAELEEAQRWIPVGWDALKVALFWMNVEKTEYCWIWTGSKNSCGYGTLHGARAHQISYKMFHGDLPEGLEIMHTCNNPACVNPGHLLAGTHQENMQSMFKLRRYSRCGKSSKYIGVSFRSDSHKWRAVLNKKSLGNYESEDDAAKAYDKAALVHYGKDAALNFPLPQPPEDNYVGDSDHEHDDRIL